MIYIPDNSTYNKCYVVQSEGVIRAYDTEPSYNTNYNYRDYYIKSNYIILFLLFLTSTLLLF